MVVIEHNDSNGLTSEQKVGLVLLSAFAILAIGLGILQIRNNMYGRFALNNQVPTNLKDQVDTVDALRFRDTDQDGLTDYDEIYVYGTSAYITDTDSDGISDGDEVKKGLNPNCPQGQSCAFMSDEAVLSTTTASGSATATLGNLPDAPTPPPVLDIQAAMQDPAQIRKMLIDAKMDPNIINKLSDAELLQLINQAMTTSTSGGAGN